VVWGLAGPAVLGRTGPRCWARCGRAGERRWQREGGGAGGPGGPEGQLGDGNAVLLGAAAPGSICMQVPAVVHCCCAFPVTASGKSRSALHPTAAAATKRHQRQAVWPTGGASSSPTHYTAARSISGGLCIEVPPARCLQQSPSCGELDAGFGIADRLPKTSGRGPAWEHHAPSKPPASHRSTGRGGCFRSSTAPGPPCLVWLPPETGSEASRAGGREGAAGCAGSAVRRVEQAA
jgi:hypothetical protein